MRTWPFIASSTINRWWATMIASTTSVTSTIGNHDSLHYLCNLHHSSHCNITMQTHTHTLYWLSQGRGSSLKCTENTGCTFSLWSQHSCHRNFTMYGLQTPGKDEDYHCPCHESIQRSRSTAPPISNLSTRNLAPNEKENGQSLQPVWPFWRREKSLVPAKNDIKPIS